MSYNSKVYRKQGGDELVVMSGGKITAAGTQASAITDVAAITGGQTPTEAEHNDALTAINAILAALRGVGIVASS